MIKLRWVKTDRDNFPKGEWFVEYFTKGEFHAHQIKRYIETYKTEFQTATLVETYSFGKVLIIDRETQSSEVDEFIYHEALVIPAILLMRRLPRLFAIMGGGEGATAREILSYKPAQKVVMADIDHNILKFARKYLSSWHNGSFDDDRLILLVQDARKFIERTKNRFDIIYSDLPCPIEGGPAYRLYTVEFYRKLKEKLLPGGIFAMQAGPGQILQLELYCVIYNTLKKVFKNVLSYSAFIPSYDMPWQFIVASDYDIMPDRRYTLMHVRNFNKKFRFIDVDGFSKSFFSIPQYIKELIKKNRKVITESTPFFFTTSRF